MINWLEYPNFSEREFACKCPCARADMDPDFMAQVQSLRSAYKKPILVTSGFRCPDYNEKVSSTGRDGPHPTGRAFDTGVSRTDAFELMKLAWLWGFTGIGWRQHGQGRFIHLDNLTEPEHVPRPTIWSYG